MTESMWIVIGVLAIMLFELVLVSVWSFYQGQEAICGPIGHDWTIAARRCKRCLRHEKRNSTETAFKTLDEQTPPRSR